MRREELPVLIRRLPGNEDLPLPQYQSAEAVAMDLHAAVRVPVPLSPGDILLVPCGFSVAVPAGFEAQVRPRSGLTAKHGVTVANSPGTIDPDYRGEVKVVLVNLGKREFTVERGNAHCPDAYRPGPEGPVGGGGRVARDGAGAGKFWAHGAVTGLECV